MPSTPGPRSLPPPTLRALCALALCAFALCLSACGYQVVGRLPPVALPTRVTSAAAEPGLPLLLRRALDLHGPRLGLSFTPAPDPTTDPATDPTGSALSVLIAHPETRALTVARASEQVIAATAYTVTLRAVAQCGPHRADLSADADYRDLSSPLSTDDARRDALSRAANTLADLLSAWALSTCTPPP